jgi:hypothetical protein
MDFSSTNTGTLKYIPNISAEKITETSSQSFMKLCETVEGRQVAEKILDNYLNNEQRNSKQLSRRGSLPKAGVGKKLSKAWSNVDESEG